MADYRALYRKWRPATFDDVSGQNAITDVLKYEVENNKLSHAYLFCGSRGTGKTSCAKILAKAVNCESPVNGNPCNKCESCRSIDAGIATDVIEMDAASNNGVDNVRDMKDEIAFTPALLKYRVYIIDEVHMMSASAFNALLKTLEEPPAYVVFILATTEYHKLPTTIISRCQRFDFRRISTDNIVSRLNLIATEEGIALTESGARVIARLARGGMRDALSLLELCSGAHKEIDDNLVFSMVGSGNRSGAYKLIRAILDRDFPTVYSTVLEVVDKSGDISVFWQELIDSYRDIMVVKNAGRAKEYLDLTDAEYETILPLASEFTPARLAYHVSILESAMADMQRTFNSKRSVAEIALTRMCDAKTVATTEALAVRIDELEREISMLKMGIVPDTISPDSVKVLPTRKDNEPTPAPKKETPTAPEVAHPEETLEVPTKKADPTPDKPAPYKGWRSVLERIGEIKSGLSAQFKNSTAHIMPDGSYLISMNAFFVKVLLSNEKDLGILRGVIAEREKKNAQEIRLIVEPLGTRSALDLSDELASNIDE